MNVQIFTNVPVRINGESKRARVELVIDSAELMAYLVKRAQESSRRTATTAYDSITCRITDVT